MHVTKLSKVGNSTGLTIPRDVLTAAGMDRGDEVTLQARDGKIEVVKAETAYSRTMEVGRAFMARYRRTMAELAK
jgi:putative addiction module antidote